MAPEQIQGKTRIESDQYALGVIVYEWISGTPPFSGTLRELIAQHLFTDPPPLQEKVPGFPFDIEQVVLKALANKPEERYSSVKEFVSTQNTVSTTIAPHHTTGSTSPFGTRIYTYSLNEFSPHAVFSVAWSPDGKRIASGGLDHTVQIWDATSGADVLTSPYTGHTAPVRSVAWSPSGTSIASSSYDNTVQVWWATVSGS